MFKQIYVTAPHTHTKYVFRTKKTNQLESPNDLCEISLFYQPELVGHFEAGFPDLESCLIFCGQTFLPCLPVVLRAEHLLNSIGNKGSSSSSSRGVFVNSALGTCTPPSRDPSDADGNCWHVSLGMWFFQDSDSGPNRKSPWTLSWEW